MHAFYIANGHCMEARLYALDQVHAFEIPETIKQKTNVNKSFVLTHSYVLIAGE